MAANGPSRESRLAACCAPSQRDFQRSHAQRKRAGGHPNIFEFPTCACGTIAKPRKRWVERRSALIEWRWPETRYKAPSPRPRWNVQAHRGRWTSAKTSPELRYPSSLSSKPLTEDMVQYRMSVWHPAFTERKKIELQRPDQGPEPRWQPLEGSRRRACWRCVTSTNANNPNGKAGSLPPFIQSLRDCTSRGAVGKAVLNRRGPLSWLAWCFFFSLKSPCQSRGDRTP